MHNIKKMLMDELYEYEEKLKKMPGGKISASDLDTVHKLTDTIKNIDKIEMLEDDGYSEGGEWMGEGRMYGTYDGGDSYDRRRARRDARGRYSRASHPDDGRMHETVGYSRGGAKEHMIRKLESMMDEAETEKEREAIRHCLEKIENA
jgi:hypothetical protein